MALIVSTWKITFDPAGAAVVLLNYGDFLTDVIQPGQPRRAEVVDTEGSAAPFIRPVGNRISAFRYTRVREYATTALSNKAVMDWIRTIDPLGKKPLRIQSSLYSTGYDQWGVSWIENHDPKERVHSTRAFMEQSFSILVTTPAWISTP